MNVAFRTDAAMHIGTGHVMRCLTLANALKAKGYITVFLCREHDGHLAEEILRQGHEVLLLPGPTKIIEKKPDTAWVPPHQGWLGESWQADAEQTRQLLSGRKLDWLIVDHYALDARWEKALRSNAAHLMVIDDLADRSHDCDLLLDQTLGREEYEYRALVPAMARILCGSEYALLRPEFGQWRDYSLARRQKPVLRKLLVNVGGIDADNITGRILESLKQASLPPDLEITVVLGLAAPHLVRVRQQAQSMPVLTDIMTHVENMAEIMANSDLAIGAAGATAWERCCLGLPTLMFVLASNQITVSSALQAAGAVTVVNDAADLAGIICRICEDPGVLKTMIDAAAGLVLGHGTATVIENMGAFHG